jgi:hypothetical protein
MLLKDILLLTKQCLMFIKEWKHILTMQEN